MEVVPADEIVAFVGHNNGAMEACCASGTSRFLWAYTENCFQLRSNTTTIAFSYKIIMLIPKNAFSSSFSIYNITKNLSAFSREK
jgi:hypothetical protein